MHMVQVQSRQSKWAILMTVCALLLALVIPLRSAVVHAAGDYSVTSPDGSIAIVVTHSSTGGLSYRATKNGAGVIDSSALGINTSLGDFASGLSYLARVENVIDEKYSLPGHKKKTYTNRANEMVLRFSKSGQEMNLVARAYDDGIAFRYRFPGSGSLSISSESSFVNMPDTANGWAMNSSSDYQGDWTYRSSFNSGGFGTPVLARLSNTWALLSESDVIPHYTASELTATSGANFKYSWMSGSAVTASRPFNTPWRMVEIGSLGTIFGSTMVENLSAPSQIADTSWIKPGISAWSWWSGDSTSDYNTQVAYVDFAASMGWKYYLCDEGWQASWMPKLINYAKSKGVGILIWVDSSNVDTESKARAAFSQWASWGAAGVKVDYIFDGGQDKMQEYDRLARVAAAYKLVINFHGNRGPEGLDRRWPNVLTREAIYGAEQYKTGAGPTARFNTVLPFTRNAVGPMDYTPITYSDNGRKTSWAHQTALAVVFTSYIQHFADRPSVYNTSIAKPFLKAVPAVWDDSRLLEGYPDQYVTIARRAGTDWFLGAIVGNNASRTVNMPLSFLDSGVSYTAQIYKDGAADTEIIAQQQSVTSASRLSIPLRVNGGLAIRFIKATGTTPTPSPPPSPSPTPAPGGISPTIWYSVVNANSGKCVDARASGTANGTVVQQLACTDTPAQQWQFRPAGDGTYTVVARTASTRVWDINNVATKNGAKLQLWTSTGGGNQQWRAEALGNGRYLLRAAHSRKCLDVPNASKRDNVQLQQWTCNRTAAHQTFRLTPQP